ncbi:Catalase [Leadbetterella byssophila DSM 17132]|uniref:Catalase n=1 Tax=Leadbetterella byssophila (strain DSM 17132 / JCM 16389 / KACC 11308 / NBRC 106382 / 4M15) TaxID=649349 RepID=E4RR97_LEAB4|nr:catalase [Leadbetterella byssophila]ADQ17583.1 Catalase [Leadbetterella byssophila DSM 17132]
MKKIQPASNPKVEQLKTHVVDNANQRLTTNDGSPIYDNNNTLKAGNRGPSLLQDHVYLDKLMHFDRERITERVVHARGSAAHGVLEIHEDITAYTSAKFLQKGAVTPLFLRFSTVAGFRGSTDLARDVRGFAIKFYTEDGNFDLVGNNIPVFFIQDAMNFPDLVHAVKPEPNNEMPQAASAHDTFWDFISLMPEAAHMVMWAMSDRAIPRSLRMMEGFGVHTFKLVNAEGKGTFVKFHWKPKLGVHSVAWNEAQKISGFNSDFHRQDLWEAIEKGNFPQWDLGVQLIPEEDELKYSFDILDVTKIVPEEVVPVKIIGTMTLNRNPENFFAETEQSAFDPGRLVPGIDVSDDPLLQGRIFSYMDTQNYRLGGPNFHELPINRSVNQKHNNQLDGFAKSDILKGEVSYFPNSKQAGCPYQAMLKGETGFQSHKQPVDGKKVRERSDSFADHFTQARLFFRSQSPEEQDHIIGAYSFELSKVTDPKIRERELAILYQIDEALASRVGENLNITPPKELDPLTLQFVRQNHPNYPIKPKKPEVEKSAALSMKVKEGKGTIETRKVAFLVENGVSKASIDALKSALEKEGAEAVLIGPKVGPLKLKEGGTTDIAHTYFTDKSVLYDAVYTPAGDSVGALKANPDYYEFLNEAYTHCKALAFAKGTESLMEKSFVEKDAGVILEEGGDWTQEFVNAMKMHRIWEREKARKVPS